MKLSTRLRLGMAALLVFLLMIGLTAAATFRQVERSFRKSAFVDRIVADAFDLNALTLDFLLNRTERARDQWLAKHRIMAEDWEAARFDRQSERAMLRKIQRNHRDLMAIFPLIADRLTTPAASGLNRKGENEVFVARFSNQILLKTGVIVSAAERLDDMSRDESVRDLKMAGWAIVLAGGVFLLLGVLVSTRIQRTIAAPLARLHRGVIQIREGDWEFRTGIRGDDEVGELSEAFDTMVDTLRRTTVSRDRLLEEIENHRTTLAAFKASEEKFRSITAAAQDAIILMDDRGRVTYWNDAAAAIFGYPAETVIGERLHQWVAPDRYHDVYKAGMAEFARSGAGPSIGKTVEVTAVGKGGREFPVELSTSAVLLNGRWTAVGSVRDVTEKKRIEARLRQSEKMESIGHLAGGIAHDFNNILYSIMGFTELAMDDAEPGSDQANNLSQVLTAADRAKHLVKQILTFARKSENRNQSVRLDIVAGEALKMIRSTVPVSIEIRQTIERCSPVMADPTQIHQVVMNLCANAAQAMEEDGGVLTVGLRDAFLTSEQARRLHGIEPGHYVHLSVSDTGDGIPPEIIGSIFDPYFTTKDVGKGTGMGLAVVHGIVRSRGGDITVESESGKGTAFHIYLPVARIAEYVGETPPSPTPGGGERILVVDDEPPIIGMLDQMLTGLGYAVTCHIRAADALAAFQADPAAFDLVLTDMAMPDMTGDKLATELMRIRPDIPVILCTGHSSRMTAEKAAEIGIRAFAMKPVAKGELTRLAREVLDGAKG